jgi:chloramphenicol 3-O phosphotransferase
MKSLKRLFLFFVTLMQMSLVSQEISQAKIIYLNGPSSSGKSTLANALQNTLTEPYLHVGIDKLIGFMPEKINNWEGGPAPLGFSWEKKVDSNGNPIFLIHSGPFAKKISRTLKDIALLFASQNYNLILDDIAFGAVDVQEWKEALKKYKVLYVKVTTPLDMLQPPDGGQGDRYMELTPGRFFRARENFIYDVEVDTNAQTVDKNVEKIIQALSESKSKTPS